MWWLILLSVILIVLILKARDEIKKINKLLDSHINHSQIKFCQI